MQTMRMKNLAIANLHLQSEKSAFEFTFANANKKIYPVLDRSVGCDGSGMRRVGWVRSSDRGLAVEGRGGYTNRP